MVYVGMVCCFIPLIISIFVFTFAFKLKFLHQIIAILLGLAAVLPISLIQFFLPNTNLLNINPVLHSFLKSLLIYGLVEECMKTVMILPMPKKNYTHKEFLFLCFIMGLSFGCFESVIYYLDHLQIAAARGAQLIYTQIFLRIFTSDIIHTFCTGLCGLFIFSCRAKPRKISILLSAIVLHGVYDFFAGFQSGLKYFAIIVVILSIIECRIKYTEVENVCENRLTIFY